MVVSIRKMLISFVLYGLFFRQIYSYIGVPYTTTSESTYAWQQLALGNDVTVSLEVFVLVCMIGLIFYEIPYLSACLTKTYTLIILFLFLGSLFWTVLTGIDTGFIPMMYTTAPFVYLTGLCVCVGTDEESYQYFLKHAKIIGIVSLLISIVSYVIFLNEHPFGILANSSVLIFYIQGFWLLCICSFGGEQKQKTVYAEICIAGFLAVLFNSRSWIIQTIIWLFAYAYCSGKRKGVVKVLKILVLVIVMAAMIYCIVNALYPEILNRLINKSSVSDTRSAQYTDIFSQTSFLDFLIGRGYGFQYESSIQGGTYSYIDNAYVLMLIRYGVAIGLTYPLIFIYPVLKRKLAKEVIPVIMWLAALGGLSIYCATTLDIKSIALAVMAGRCLFQSVYRQNSEELMIR